MRPVVSRAQMRAFEHQVIEGGVPGILLMENAGRGAAHLIGLRGRPRQVGSKKNVGGVGGSCVRCADEASLQSWRVLILCGPGNNGGDGFVVARHLAARGAEVKTLLWGELERLSEDARTALFAWEAVGGQVERLRVQELAHLLDETELVVDALLGTGATRLVEGELASVVRLVNQSSRAVISLDLPSGLDADTGRVLGEAIVAEHTVTFGHLKRGLLTTFGQVHAGRITLSHIGVPSRSESLAQVSNWLLEEGDLRGRLVVRSPTAHKGSSGHVVVVAGSPGKVGAAALVASAALRLGAGLCTVASSEEVVRLLDREVLEVMTHAIDPHAGSPHELFMRASSLIVGPGLGASEEARFFLESALAAGRPTVLDADALRLCAANPKRLREHPALILTPHPGEAAALLGLETREIEEDRFGAAGRLADLTGAIVVLKGSRSLIAEPGGRIFVSAWGSPALATAGSGDVLAGMLGAELALAQERAPLDAVFVSVGLHALAGERWSEVHGDVGLLASEIAEQAVLVRARLLS